MSNGITTQAIALVFSFVPPLNKLREMLASYSPTFCTDDASWPFEGPGLSISIPEVPDTAVVLDIAHQPWPDDLSQNEYSSDIFLTWKLGNFGPATRPAALSRALTRTFLNHDESQAVREHKSFIRIRTVSTAPDAPLRNSLIRKPSVACRHLAVLDALAIQLLDLPGALAYFNPAGANLLPRNDLLHFTKQAQDLGLENNLVWTNRFFYNVSDNWLFFETLGNHQLYLPDLELPISRHSPEIAGQCRAFLANITLRLINDPQSITSDTVLSGPSDLNYKARFFPTSLTEPNRSVILLLPEGTNELPPEFPKHPNA